MLDHQTESDAVGDLAGGMLWGLDSGAHLTARFCRLLHIRARAAVLAATAAFTAATATSAGSDAPRSCEQTHSQRRAVSGLGGGGSGLGRHRSRSRLGLGSLIRSARIAPTLVA